MTGRSPGSVLPLFYGADPVTLQQFGFGEASLFPAAYVSTSHEDARSGPRNMFGLASKGDIYRGQGTGEDERLATRKMLEQLAIHMKKCTWPGATNHSDNRKIPSGYTYLAQFSAHDLVHNVDPLTRLNDLPGYFQRDYRTERLVLDTLYGGGPFATLLPFEINGEARRQRHRLRLGHVPISETKPGPTTDKPPRDIGRAFCPFLSDSQYVQGVADALLADPRNDDHLIIAQLAALFHELHNIVYRKLPGKISQYDDFSTYRRFLDARKVVTIAYRSVIVSDFLSLILEKDIYCYYKSDTTRYPQDFLDQTDDNRVPVEFSHAAFRFGHVMARASYILNDKRKNGDDPDSAPIGQILDRSSSRDPTKLPLACTWLVEWSRFFDMADGTPLNYSRPIRPYIGEAELTDNSYFVNEDQADGGIFYRDLVRGADAGVRTVDSIIQHLRPEDRDRSLLLKDRGYRQQEIRRWLMECGGPLNHDFCAADRLSLAQDPPLLFFILFEAAHTQNGERLGILGSVILAEVFFAAYKRTLPRIEGDVNVQAKLRHVFGAYVPTDMAGIIRFMKREGSLLEMDCNARSDLAKANQPRGGKDVNSTNQGQ